MDMYMEEILDHYKKPHNKGALDKAEIKLFDSNPLCGDEQEIFIKLDKQNKVEHVGFTGKGCAISIAATSMLTDELKGKSLHEVMALPNEFVFDLLGVQISAMRVKCALLGLKTSQKAIINYVSSKDNV